jgi:hypothetical protein
VEDRFPFRFQRGTNSDEQKEVKWLRQHGDYLAPDVSFFRLDIWRMIGLYLSGLVLTNATPLAFLCFLAFVIHWVGRNTNTYGLVGGLLALSVSVFVVMVILRWL